MKKINFHYEVLDEDRCIFQYPHPWCHFGDKIAILNMHLHFNPNSLLNISNVNGEDDKLLARLFFGDNVTYETPTYITKLGSSKEETYEIFSEIYKTSYVKFKTGSFDKKYVSYSCKTNFLTELKTPPYFLNCIDYLSKIYPTHQFIEVGEKIGLEKTIEIMSESYIFIGVDNGLSHLCRCLDSKTIHIICEHNFKVDRGFPSQFYPNYLCCKSESQLIKLVSKNL